MNSRLDLSREVRRIRPTRQRHLGICPSGKVRYRDKSEGMEILKRLQNIATYQVLDYGSTSRQECRVYECGKCRGFHLTSQRFTLGSDRAVA